MKKIVPSIIAFIFCFCTGDSFAQIVSTLTSSSCDCETYNAFTRDGRLENKEAFHVSRLSNKVFYLDPEKANDLETLYEEMELDNGTTFALARETPGRLSDKVYRAYQQYYNGVPVEGGGYTDAYRIPGGWTSNDPCLQSHLFSPRILSRISVNTSPTISDIEIPDIIRMEKMYSAELVITHNLNRRCEYRLAWKTTYSREREAWISWIDAHSGELIKTVEVNMSLNAPTENYGVRNLNDRTVGNTTTLQSPDQKIKVFDFEFPGPLGAVDVSEWTNDRIFSTTANEWTTEAPPAAYQAFYVTSAILPAFEGLGIDFDKVNVASGVFSNAYSLEGSSVSEAFISVGEDNGTLALYDVIGHELGHTFLNQFLNSDAPGNKSLHEGISDMLGTYVESVVSNNLDWRMGDDNNTTYTFSRDLDNPPSNIDCFTEVAGFFLESQIHHRSRPLSYWFYLISAGNQTYNIQPQGIQQAIKLVLDALNLVGRDSDYPELMTATLAIAEEKFGICSNEFLSIARAWEVICVPTGLAVNGTVSCSFTLTGPDGICEEYGNVQVCINGGLPNAHYRWYLLSSSLDFESLLGMQGNIQEGGNCLTLTQFPQFPYYPQNIVIRVYSPTLGPRFIQTKQITIMDCDGDDPTCKEYYESFNNNPEERAMDKKDEINEVLQYDNIKVFDLMGKLILEEKTGNFNVNDLRHRGLVIITYHRENGEIVNTTKYFSGLD